MKTLGIIAAIVTVIGLLVWIVAQTLKTDQSDSAYNMHPSNFEKPDLEHRLEFKDQTKKGDQTLDLTDLLDDEKNSPKLNLD